MKRYVNHYEGPREQTLTTPRDFFEQLHAVYHFTVDGAANPDGSDSLLPRWFATYQSWNGERVFCNPPWSDIPPFVEAAIDADLAVLLVPARVNAKWFHRALAIGARPRYFCGKLRFGKSKWNSPVDCLLLIFERPWIVLKRERGSQGGSRTK